MNPLEKIIMIIQVVGAVTVYFGAIHILVQSILPMKRKRARQ
jgi:hypothetical protein